VAPSLEKRAVVGKRGGKEGRVEDEITLFRFKLKVGFTIML
jgi:hypothetical protein